ncbi:hypothetical protein D3C76_1416890 [compost metagenome]
MCKSYEHVYFRTVHCHHHENTNDYLHQDENNGYHTQSTHFLVVRMITVSEMTQDCNNNHERRSCCTVSKSNRYPTRKLRNNLTVTKRKSRTSAGRIRVTHKCTCVYHEICVNGGEPDQIPEFFANPRVFIQALQSAIFGLLPYAQRHH